MQERQYRFDLSNIALENLIIRAGYPANIAVVACQFVAEARTRAASNETLRAMIAARQASKSAKNRILITPRPIGLSTYIILLFNAVKVLWIAEGRQ